MTPWREDHREIHVGDFPGPFSVVFPMAGSNLYPLCAVNCNHECSSFPCALLGNYLAEGLSWEPRTCSWNPK